jgi:amidohydrolase
VLRGRKGKGKATIGAVPQNLIRFPNFLGGMIMWSRLMALAVLALLSGRPAAAQSDLDQQINKNIGDWIGTYKHLHENPELSMQEKETSALIAGQLRRFGYEVTDHFGKYAHPENVSYAIVAVLKNGPGPTVYVRTDMDALPVTENTGLPYASKVRVKRPNGEVGVMHACGHDLHMTVFLGTAKMLAENKSQWSGTLVLLGQPAEEIVSGAKAILQAGLYAKFPKPDYVLALHDNSSLPAGKVAWTAGPILAGGDSVDITIRGYGGHGAVPQTTKDPIVIAAELIVDLQTVVSREMNPLEPTVITVGSIHAGNKHNIIPDEAHLQLTVRTMRPEQRAKALEAITRMTKGIAAAAGVPEDRAPIIEISTENVPATINDPTLSRRIGAALEKSLGKENVLPAIPVMASEDFSLFALEEPHPPITMFWLGAVDPAKWQQAQEQGTRLPSLHSSEFAPLPEPAIRTGVKAMTSAVAELLKK